MNKLFMKIYKALDKKFDPIWDTFSISNGLLEMKPQYIIYNDKEKVEGYTFVLEVEDVVYIEYRDTYAMSINFYHSEHNEKGTHEAIEFIEYIPSWAIDTSPEEQAFDRWVDKYNVMIDRWKDEYR